MKNKEELLKEFDMKQKTNILRQFKQWILSIVMVSTWKWLIIPIGVIILLMAFKLHIITGFALVFGLTVGSIGEKLRWWY